jgi:hypothetical protein
MILVSGNTINTLRNTYLRLGHGSNGRVPGWQMQGPKFRYKINFLKNYLTR